ncbi:MAG TPA: sigma-70 family RNA polymerase sigma factor [Pedobacter sp.]|uniref:RNA polymerase sigma factor n=1 Tax=Pedobacter sp. TaxID=1411316 RepID=UPI002CF32A2F|nr:sigma-70 family RNA polymerase sigma factor [Pedobacter sp.]HMI05559.1 sigma-70 family RNA polymerase sigma factor [Pedobacter sp.]
MDEQAFLALMGTHQGIVHKICRMYRDGAEDREDLFQEITYQLWKAFPSFKGTAKVSTWMYRIALNTAIASFRKKRPAVEYHPVLPDHADDLQDENLAIRQEQLFLALKRLDDGEKAIITLYLEDLSYRQIAEVTGISESNVGVKLNRIKHKIQKLLNL